MMLAAVTAVIVFILDLVTKGIIQNDVSLHNVTVIEGFFHITYAKNTGMAWSLLEGQQTLLAVISAVAILAMILYLVREKPGKVTVFALGLMIGGAAGNLYDRAVLNYVRDFLNFYIFGYDFPIFNVADSALTVGVGLLLLLSFFEEKKHDDAKI
ncbi:MAG: signal peptidase II [Solobacterium sp.]|nr:signal peptidase II [Solobacterium sp.]